MAMTPFLLVRLFRALKEQAVLSTGPQTAFNVFIIINSIAGDNSLQICLGHYRLPGTLGICPPVALSAGLRLKFTVA